MGSTFCDLSIGNDQNLIGMADGVQPVGDDQQSFTPAELTDGFLDAAFIVGVDAGSGLVENNDRGILQNTPGDRDALCFPPERVAPPSPITVSKPSGNFMIKS